jgi:hypothetical protein
MGWALTMLAILLTLVTIALFERIVSEVLRRIE